MNGKRYLGMFSIALALTVITIVIFDLRNPMMNFLVNNIARGYIVVLGICAAAEGVILLLMTGKTLDRRARKAQRRAEEQEY